MATVSPVFDVPPPLRTRSLRLLLVDDHPVVRAGLCALLSLEADFDVVGEASNANDGIEFARRLRPDVVITDISLGAKNGIYLISELRKLARGGRVLALTVHSDEEYFKAALMAGARGYLLKDAARADLVQAIRTVAAGDYYMCPSVSDAVVSGYLARYVSATDWLPCELTGREREIMTLVAQGQSNKNIAWHLGLSIKTIGKHRSNFMYKLDLHNTAAITRFALGHGLVPSAATAQHSEH